MENNAQFLQVVNETLNQGYVELDELPDIDLYMDQITTLLEGKISQNRRSSKEKLLTKTMINNYSKEGLLKQIKGKKYSKQHILMMLLIYHLKQTLSLADIKTLFTQLEPEISLDKNHYTVGPVEEIYGAFSQMTQQQRQQIPAFLERCQEQFPLETETPAQLLLTVLYLTSLADTFTTMAEKLIDRSVSSPLP